MSAKAEAVEVVATLRLTNSQARAIDLFLEPWGEVYVMPAGATFEVMARGPRGGTLEIAVADSDITVWGWAGSVVALSHEGEGRGASAEARTAVPVAPDWLEGENAEGTSSRSIAHRM